MSPILFETTAGLTTMTRTPVPFAAPHNDLLPKSAAPACQAQAGAGIAQLKQLTQYSEAEIAHLHDLGPAALGLLRQTMAANGLVFKPSQVAGPSLRES